MSDVGEVGGQVDPPRPDVFPPLNINERLLTLREAAECLDIDVLAMNKLGRSGAIPCVWVGDGNGHSVRRYRQVVLADTALLDRGEAERFRAAERVQAGVTA